MCARTAKGFLFRTTVFLIAAAFALPVFAQQNNPGTKGAPVLMLNFQDAENSDFFRSSRLADRFKVISKAAVSPCSNAWQVRIELPKQGEQQTFHAKTSKRKRELLLTVPAKYDLWASDPVSWNWLMSMLIMANLGEPFRDGKFDRSSTIRTHWLSRGLARKAAFTSEINPYPFQMPCPGAWALASNGIFPTVRQIVSGTVPGNLGDAGEELEMEYTGLLIDALANLGFFRKKLAEPLLRATLTAPDLDPFDCFFSLVKELPVKSGSNLTEQDLDEWFRRSVEKSLVSYFAPLSTEYFETCYRRITKIEFTDPDGIPQSCRIGNLAENWTFLPDGNARIDLLISQLNVLAFCAPPEFQENLSAIRLALTRIRTDRSPEAAAALRDTEKKLFEKITRRVLLERYLLEAERRIIPPASRFERTLGTARAERDSGHLLLPQIQSTLDRWDDYQ